ncbi:MAG: hypothetical protein M1834_003974 [Cirrosporium novae-zelandiae]|nr:MAG: hypothetical protein M1834_003974 [Cirrosporium novae-zelandiae]
MRLRSFSDIQTNPSPITPQNSSQIYIAEQVNNNTPVDPVGPTHPTPSWIYRIILSSSGLVFSIIHPSQENFAGVRWTMAAYYVQRPQTSQRPAYEFRRIPLSNDSAQLTYLFVFVLSITIDKEQGKPSPILQITTPPHFTFSRSVVPNSPRIPYPG